MFFLTALQAYIEQVSKIRRCSDLARRTPLMISNETLLHYNKHWSLDQIDIVICSKHITLVTFRVGRRHDNHHIYFGVQNCQYNTGSTSNHTAGGRCMHWILSLAGLSQEIFKPFFTSAWACSLGVCPILCFVILLSIEQNTLTPLLEISLSS